MKLDSNLFKIILKYLNQTDTAEERRRLYQWYDSIGTSGKEIETDAATAAQAKGKERLLAEISTPAKQHTIVRLYSYRIAAACIILLLSGVALQYFLTRESLTPLKTAELEHIRPDHNAATITLSTGEVVALDSLSNNESLSVGNTVIQKNKSGQLAYRSANGKMNANITSTLKTSKSSQYSIVLSDGTKVYLNAATRLTYPQQFAAGNRIVELDGEAYFEVQKTAEHSRFIVKTRGQDVEVLGTKFNINAYLHKTSIKTTLAEGSVRIAPSNKSLASLLLKPNQQGILGHKSITRANVDAGSIIAWKDGFFVFDGNNTDETIHEIGEWYNIEVDYRRKKKSMEYAGKIPKNISLGRLIQLLDYADIKIQAFKNNKNQQKLIIN